MGQRLIAVAVVVASACTALKLSSTSQDTVVVSNNPYTFPTPGMQTFTVSPLGATDDDSLQSVVLSACNSQWFLMLNTSDPLPTRICNGGSGSSSGFAIDTSDGVTLCPHYYTFTVGFSGSQPGVSSCNVLLTSSPFFGGSAQTVTLMLSGSGSGSSGIMVGPSTINFGDVQINTNSSPSLVTVKNNDMVNPVTVTGTLDNTTFGVTPSYTSFPLGPGANTSFDVTCSPTALGPQLGTLSFAEGSSSGMTSLSCNGIDSTVTVMPSQVNFDSTLVGRPPANKNVTITGPSATTIDMVSLDAAATAAGVSLVSSPQGQSIGGGKTITLGYSAAAMHAAGPLGNLSIKVSSDTTARNVAISGEALLGGVGTNPASVEFGAVCAGSKTSKDVEVYASEAGNIAVNTLTPPSAPFDATTGDNLPKTLMGNHNGPSVTVKTTMMPAAAGEFVDKFVLTTDVPNMAMTDIAMHGIALAGGIAATPDAVHFGTAMTGSTTSINQVQLTNCGSADLMFQTAAITGANASEFTLIGANPPRTLKPTESEVFMVVMQPESLGYKTADLVLTHSAGTTTAALDGTGTGNGSTKDRETYYACATGRGTSGWPIALALLALRRGRRRRDTRRLRDASSLPDA